MPFRINQRWGAWPNFGQIVRYRRQVAIATVLAELVWVQKVMNLDLLLVEQNSIIQARVCRTSHQGLVDLAMTMRRVSIQQLRWDSQKDHLVTVDQAAIDLVRLIHLRGHRIVNLATGVAAVALMVDRIVRQAG